MQQLNLLGTTLTACTRTEFLSLLEHLAAQPGRQILANHNLHSVALFHCDPVFRAYYERSAAIHIDGMALIFWAQLLGLPVSAAQRQAFLDWQHDFFTLALRQGWRVYFIGGAPGVADKAADHLRAQHPGLLLATDHGFHAKQGAENAAVLHRIAEFAPQILIVGMGMPLQERWVSENWDDLPNSCLILNQGAAFNYIAGVEKAAPRWLGALGLEWLYRFAHAPRRLFARYFIEPWRLLPFMLDDLKHAWRGQPVLDQPIPDQPAPGRDDIPDK